MNNFYPIKFSFGTSISAEIPEKHIDYYLLFFTKYFNNEFILRIGRTECYTIAVDDDDGKSSEKFVSSFIDLIKKKFHIINDDNKFINSNDTIFIDIRGLIRSQLLLILSNIINDLLNIDNNDNVRFILLLDSVESNYKAIELLKDYYIKKKILLIDLKKRFYFGKEEPEINDNFDIESTSISYIERIEYKLIKKIGHFVRLENGIHKTCHQYFYDGSYCTIEIQKLLLRKIDELKDKLFIPDVIVFHSPQSPWLADSMYSLSIERERLRKYVQLNEMNIIEYKDYNATEARNILFVVDLVHTGKTFIDCLNNLRQLNSSNCIKSICILSSNSDNSNRESKYIRLRNEHNEDIVIDYFLFVDQIEYRVGSNICPMCEYELLPKNTTAAIDDKLSSYEMWLMIDSAGYKNEDFLPDNDRKPLKNIPNALNLIKQNGPYLAYKFDRKVNKYYNNRNVMIIFPDETSNIMEMKQRHVENILLEETPSGYFILCLRELKKYSYLGLPRVLLTQIKKKEVLLNEIENRYPKLHANLASINNEIIIFDEMNKSGGTISTIVEILKYYKLKPIAYMPLFNFSSDELKIFKDINIDLLPLYEFHYHEVV